MAEKKTQKASAAKPDDRVALTEDTDRTQPRLEERQFPSLFADGEDGRPSGGDAVEVAGRSGDQPEATTTQHRKVFTVQRVAWEQEWEPHDNVHERNKRAVRQYMVSQGLRPDADVSFAGVEDHPFDDKSLDLVYTVEAVPAVVARDFDLAHVSIGQPDKTGTQIAEEQSKRAEILTTMRDPLRELGNEKSVPEPRKGE